MPAPLPPPQLDLRQRFGAMRNLPPFLREIWASSPWLTSASLGLRLVRALMPVATLYVGKLIIDEAVRLVGAHVPHDTLSAAWQSGELSHLVQLLLLEFALAIASETSSRPFASNANPNGTAPADGCTIGPVAMPALSTTYVLIMFVIFSVTTSTRPSGENCT